MSLTATYQVTGMTCDHCASAVSAELQALATVETVDVDLPTGAVTVTASAPLEQEQVRAAVDEAGYALADGPSGGDGD